VADVIREGKNVTYDLGGKAGTREMGEAIIDKLVGMRDEDEGKECRKEVTFFWTSPLLSSLFSRPFDGADLHFVKPMEFVKIW